MPITCSAHLSHVFRVRKKENLFPYLVLYFFRDYNELVAALVAACNGGEL